MKIETVYSTMHFYILIPSALILTEILLDANKFSPRHRYSPSAIVVMPGKLVSNITVLFTILCVSTNEIDGITLINVVLGTDTASKAQDI